MAIESKMPRAFGKTSGGSWKGWMAAVLAVLVILGGVCWFWRYAQTSEETPTWSSTAYQAVFLDNGQVYFGHLSSMGEYFRLTDVFYLQYRQNPQTGDPAADADVSIIKLGNEVHGPEDWMTINAEHVLFTEDLKTESRVATAIADYNSKHTN